MACGDRLVTPRYARHGLWPGRGLRYLHHGIDMGDGTVVHARPDDPRRVFAGGRVERTSLEAFADGRPVAVANEPPAAFPPDEVARRAAAHVGREGYSPAVDNCEHFATWCATGRRQSRQVDLVADRVRRTTVRLAATVASRATTGSAGRMAVRTLVGTTVRLGMRSLVPGAILAEGVALAAEFHAHTGGQDAATARAAGERAGLAASVGFFAAGGLAAGPAGVLAGACAGAALWTAGAAATRVLGSPGPSPA
jgi:hypothetical protein